MQRVDYLYLLDRRLLNQNDADTDETFNSLYNSTNDLIVHCNVY